MVTITLPSLNASEALSVFPEINAADSVTLATSEGTIELEQSASDWASLVSIQIDDDDALDDPDSNDIKYKLSGSWPSYASGKTFDTATFDASGHTTLGGVAGDASVTTLRHALRADISEDMTGSTESFDIFSNEVDLDASFGTAATALETSVSSNWSALVAADTESLGAGILSRATAASSNPGRHILQQVLDAGSSHSGNAGLVTNLAARSSSADFAAVPLAAGDIIQFNITFQPPSGSPQGQDLPTGGLGDGAPGARNHVFKVEITLA